MELLVEIYPLFKPNSDNTSGSSGGSSSGGSSGGGSSGGTSAGHGGGSGNDDKPPIIPLPSDSTEIQKVFKRLYGPESTLTETQQKLFIESIAMLKTHYPILYQICLDLSTCGISLKCMIVPSLNSSAQYSILRILRFQSEADINYVALSEELVHGLQHNKFYFNRMENPSLDINIELEAKVLCEALQALKDKKFYESSSNILIGASQDLKTAVKMLMNSILAEGGFKPPQHELFIEVGRLVNKEWRNRYPKSTFEPNFTPEVLKNYLTP